MKTMKKITVLAFALIVVLSLSVTAFAVSARSGGVRMAGRANNVVATAEIGICPYNEDCPYGEKCIGNGTCLYNGECPNYAARSNSETTSRGGMSCGNVMGCRNR